MNDAALQSLTSILWPDGNSLKGQQVYWLLDGGRDPDIVNLIRLGRLEYTCLFAGKLHPRLQAAAPYLVHLSPGSPTTDRLLRRGWGKAWGILSVAAADITLTQQRLHFKKLLRVKTEQGQELAFRFYDPRVLNLYLPTCTNDEFQTFLGPLTKVIAETRAGRDIRAFDLHRDGMRLKEYQLGGIVDGSPTGYSDRFD